MDIIVAFISNHSTLLSFILGVLLLAVNYVSSEQASKFEAESQKFQKISVENQKKAQEAHDKNTDLIEGLLNNASNPDLLSEKLLELKTEWINKLANNTPTSPDIDHILSTVKKIKMEKEERTLTREENKKRALREHELLANPIWNQVSEIFYKKMILLEKENIFSDVKKISLGIDKTATEPVYEDQADDIRDLITAIKTSNNHEFNLMIIRKIFPVSRDSNEFTSSSMFLTLSRTAQIIINSYTKTITISSSKSGEVTFPIAELKQHIDEFNKIVGEVFDDNMIQQLIRD